MSEGRGSASMNIVNIMISLLCLLFLAESINAETHIVGGVKGWTFNTKNWPNGKEFSAGDVLGKIKLNLLYSYLVMYVCDPFSSIDCCSFQL